MQECIGFERMTSRHGIARCIVGLAAIFVAWSSFRQRFLSTALVSFLSFCLKMGRYYAVVGCTSRSHDYLNRKLDNGMRFFSLPAVIVVYIVSVYVSYISLPAVNIYDKLYYIFSRDKICHLPLDKLRK
jgi:hypothetical protein